MMMMVVMVVVVGGEGGGGGGSRGLDCSVLCDGCACEEIEQSINETCMHKSKYYIYKLIIHGLKYMCMYRHTYMRLHYLTFRHVRLHNKTKHNIHNHT